MQHPIEFYYNLFEEALTGLKIAPESARGAKPGEWSLKLGSASVWVDIFQGKDAQGNLMPNYGYLQVMAPVCDVPVNNQHLFTKELLELNHSLYGVGFTIFSERAYIKAIRELDGLDKSEISSTLNRVGVYADDWDDKLKAKYFPTTPFSGGGRPA